MQKYSFIWLIIYLWVIGTLPMHQHVHEHSRNKTETHFHAHDSHDHSHHDDQDDQDECILCINLHIPYALDELPKVEFSVLTFDYSPSYNETLPPIWKYDFIALTSNKDPPFSIIS